jgi:DNA phosphorothioation-associated putative methyltransferase
MHRTRLSRPVTVALEHGVVREDLSLLDYGCGHGDDFRSLRACGIDAVGWDPAHLPDGERRPSDVCVLSYVLNVIEDTNERAEVLRRAFALARRTLVIAVRVDRSLRDAESFGDGVLTGRRTFQKLYSQTEFREYVQQVLAVEPVIADLGIAYIFRDEDERTRYFASTTFRRRLSYNVGVHQRFAQHPIGAELIAATANLGRLPHVDEFEGWSALAEEFGGVARVGRLVLSAVDAEAFAGSVRERAEDILTYFAKLRFAGARIPGLTALPSDIQRDIRITWGSFKQAQDEALVLLFSLGREDVVRRAMRESTVGKLVGDDFYIHVSALDLIPPVLRLAEFAARRLVGQVDADIVKISEAGRAVSFLRYPDFDNNPHPGLRSSLRVYLPRAKYELREYGHENPFILHRKELFVAPDYPGRDRFEELTRAEEAAGVLNGSDIGTRQGWLAVLAAQGLHLEGHRLFGLKQVDPIPVAAPPHYGPSVARNDKSIEKLIDTFGVLKSTPSFKKPVLVLTVLTRMRRGLLTENKIRYGEIEAEYKAALTACGRAAGNLPDAFVRLQSSPFWNIKAPKDMLLKAIKSKLLRDDVWAEFDAETWQLLRLADIGQLVERLETRWLGSSRQSVGS